MDKGCPTNLCNNSSHTATDEAFSQNDLKKQTRSSVPSSNPDEGEKRKFKFPKVAMKFCSNQRLKIDKLGNEYVGSIPLVETEPVKRLAAMHVRNFKQFWWIQNGGVESDKRKNCLNVSRRGSTPLGFLRAASKTDPTKKTPFFNLLGTLERA